MFSHSYLVPAGPGAAVSPSCFGVGWQTVSSFDTLLSDSLKKINLQEASIKYMAGWTN